MKRQELQDMADRLAAEDCPQEVTADGLVLAVQALRHVLNGLPSERVPGGPTAPVPHDAVIAGCTASAKLLVQITDVLGRLEAQLYAHCPHELYQDRDSVLIHDRAVNALNALQRSLSQDVPSWAVRHVSELAWARLRDDSDTEGASE